MIILHHQGQIPKIIVNMGTELLVVKCAENFATYKKFRCVDNLFKFHFKKTKLAIVTLLKAEIILNKTMRH